MSGPPPGRLGPDELLAAGVRELGLQLNPEQVRRFRAYREEILRWSQRMNLTALRDPREIVRVGFLDALACSPLVPPAARRALDIGSGAGFPAIPLALTHPTLAFTLVEASRKKASFLRHILRSLHLTQVRVLQCRVEALAADPSEREAYDLALARAVAAPPEAGRLVLPFLRPGGLFLAQLGPETDSAASLDRLGALGFEAAGEQLLPPACGAPGRRAVALRRLPGAPAPPRFT